MSWIPGISQLKSAVQLVTGDVEGAAQTQKEFFQRCPVVSQVTSTVQFVAGDTKGAVETQKACLRTVSDVADGIPVVGHVKGIAHYVCNDEEGGDRAMKAATRTTAVTAAGAGGFLIGGPVGAVAGGVYGGAAYDTAHSAVTDKPQGLFQAVDTAVNNPNGGNIFDAVLIPVSDGFAGHAGGQMVNKMNVLSMQKKLDKMSNQMTDGMGKMSGAEALKLGDSMMQLDSKLSNAKGVHYVPGPKGHGSVAVQASPLPAAPVTYVKEQTYQKGRISSGTIYTKSNRTSAPRRTATTNNVAAVTNTANNASQNGNSSESEDEQRHNKKECGGETTDTEDENEKQQRVTAKRLNAEAEKSLRNSNVTRSGLVEDIQNCIRAWRKLVLQMGHRLSREELIKVEQEMKNLNEMLHFVVVDEMLFCLTETVTERTKKMLKAFFECVKKIKMMYKRCLNVIRSILSPIMKSPNSISTIDDERFEQLLNQIHAIPTTEFIAFLQTCNFRFPASSNRRMIDFYQDIARFIGSLEGAAFRPETNTLSPTPGQTNATFAVFSSADNGTLYVAYNYYSEVEHYERHDIHPSRDGAGQLTPAQQRNIVQRIYKKYRQQLRREGIQRIQFVRHSYPYNPNENHADHCRINYRLAHSGHAEIVALAVAKYYGIAPEELILGVNKDLCIYCVYCLYNLGVPIDIGSCMHVEVRRWKHPDEIGIEWEEEFELDFLE